MYREHPIKILRHAAKNIWLLIFPVLRAVRSYNLDFDALYHWLTGLWIDVIFLAVMAAFGYFRWLFTFYRLGNHHIRHTTGMFIKTETVIAYDRISALLALSAECSEDTYKHESQDFRSRRYDTACKAPPRNTALQKASHAKDKASQDQHLPT